LLGSEAVLADAPKRPAKEAISFGTLQTASAETARDQALAWLKKVGKADPATVKKFDTIWADNDRSVLDRVADALALGDIEAAQLLEDARDASTPAPTEVPAILKDGKRDAFFRSNLALAYAKALAHRRVYEEELQVLREVKPDDNLVDPANYYFHRAVAEYSLMRKEDAARSIVGVLEDCADAPERYKMVSVLMLYDMQNWQPKDLGDIARKMDNIERRLELARGGPQTQQLQKDVELRLKEMIKKLENQAKTGGS
jgi:hypothetical protein